MKNDDAIYVLIFRRILNPFNENKKDAEKNENRQTRRRYNLFMISKNTLETYCCESISNIENYKEAVSSEELYVCHHRNEISMGLSRQDLIMLGLYWNRPASELIFMKNEDHTSIHHTGKTVTTETKRKLSENNGSHRQEVRDKMSKTRKERKLGIGNKYAVGNKGHSGLKWITNDIKEICIKVGEQPPQGWRFGRMKKR